MRFSLYLLLACLFAACAPAAEVSIGESSLTIDAPDLDASLFVWLPGCMGYPTPRNETERPFKTAPKEIKLLALENEFLRVRFMPEIGARLYDVTWKDDGSSPLYRVEKTIFQQMSGDEGHGYMVHLGSMKWGFPNFGHTPMDHCPWEHEILREKDGAAVFHAWCIEPHETGLRCDVHAKLSPGSTALDFTFSVSNPTPHAQPYDLWIDGYVPASTFTEVALPTDRVITHQEGWNLRRNMIIPFPFHNTSDLRYLKKWHGSNGIFPLTYSDGFAGFYSHEREQGVLRTFEPAQGIGTKFWMPWANASANLGELFSGSNPTHDERCSLAPGKERSWTERWTLVRGLHGIDAGDSVVAVHLEHDAKATRTYLAAAQSIAEAQVEIDITPKGNGRTVRLGAWKGAVPAGAAATADFPALAETPGFVTCRVTYEGKTYAWTVAGEQLKTPFEDEELAKTRSGYREGLKPVALNSEVNSETKTKDANKSSHRKRREENTFPTTPAYQRERTITVDTGMRLFRPNAAAVLKDGTLVIADANHLLHFDAAFKYLGKWGGTEQLFCPMGLATDAKGRLLVADTGNRRVLRMTLGESWTVEREWKLAARPAGLAWRDGAIACSLPLKEQIVAFRDDAPDGPVEAKVLAKELRAPFGLCYAEDGALLAADTLNARVLRIAPDGKTTTLAGEAEGLNKPSRICRFGGRVLVADAGRAKLFELKNGGCTEALDGGLLQPVSLAIPSDLLPLGEDLLVVTADPAQLMRLGPDLQVKQRYTMASNGTRSYRYPGSMAKLPDGRSVMADLNGGRLHVFDAEGQLLYSSGAWGREDGQLWVTPCVRADAKGFVYVSDLLNYRVLRFDPQLKPLGALELEHPRTDGELKTSFWYAHGLAVAPDGRLYVADHAHRCLRVYSPAPENTFERMIELGEDVHPLGLDVDAKGRVIVANSFRPELLIFDKDDRRNPERHIAFSHDLLQPWVVAWDANGGFWTAGRSDMRWPPRELWRFNARYSLDRTWDAEALRSPSDLVHAGKDVWIVRSHSDTPNADASDKDGKMVKRIGYPPLPLVPGEIAGTNELFALEDGGFYVHNSRGDGLFRFNPDGTYRESVTAEGIDRFWTRGSANDLLATGNNGESHVLFGRDGLPGKPLAFKGVDRFWTTIELRNGEWLIGTEKGMRLFRGTGDAAEELPLPEWAKEENLWLNLGVKLTDGSWWFSRWTRRGMELLRIGADGKKGKTIEFQNRNQVLNLRAEADGGFLAFVSDLGVLRIDAAGEKPVVVVPGMFYAGDRLSDGRLLLYPSDGADELRVYKPLPPGEQPAEKAP